MIRHLPNRLLCIGTAVLLACAPLLHAGTPSSHKPPAKKSGNPPTESLAEIRLKALVDQEKSLWTEVKSDNGPEAHASLVAKFQDVLNGYAGIIRDNPNFVPAYVAWGLLLRKTGQRKHSEEVFVKANDLNPNLPIVKNELGNFLFEDGKYKTALGYYLAAISLAPKQPLYHYELGCLLAEYKKFFIADKIFTASVIDHEMQKAFQRAANLAPDNIAFAYRYAESFYDLSKPDWPKALSVWEALQKRVDPGIARETVMLHRANILIKEGNGKEARTLLSQVKVKVLQQNKERLIKELNDHPTPAASSPPAPGKQ